MRGWAVASRHSQDPEGQTIFGVLPDPGPSFQTPGPATSLQSWTCCSARWQSSHQPCPPAGKDNRLPSHEATLQAVFKHPPERYPSTSMEVDVLHLSKTCCSRISGSPQPLPRLHPQAPHLTSLHRHTHSSRVPSAFFSGSWTTLPYVAAPRLRQVPTSPNVPLQILLLRTLGQPTPPLIARCPH